MIAKTKQVYYCEHCKRHCLSRSAMEKHETHCTMNPERVCRWERVDGEHGQVELALLVGALRRRAPLDPAAINWLHDEVDGCPACMLAALRQSGVEYHYDAETGRNLWDYGEEIERFRRDERQAADYAEARAIESGWA